MGVLNRGNRDKHNETGLKEGGGIEMSIYSAFHIRDARSLRLNTYRGHTPIHRLDVHFHCQNHQKVRNSGCSEVQPRGLCVPLV